MLFYSDLIGKFVYSETHARLGSLQDILFLNSDTPRATTIVVEQSGHRREIPITALRTVNGHIEIKRGETNKSETALSIAKVLLDKQIIDLVGNKVVRANDIVLQDIPTFSLSGIDIGFSGILRRIGLERSVRAILRTLHLEIPLQLLSWGDILTLELNFGQIKLKQHEERLARIHEEDLADYLETTNVQNVEIFLKSLETHKAAAVIKNLPVNYQAELFQNFDPQKAANLIEHIEPDGAVDILLALERGKRDKIMKILPNEKQMAIHQLMTFSRTPVGKLMTNEFCAVESHMTARDIMKIIRRNTTDFTSLGAIYVLNRDGQLVGVFSPHELLMQDADTPAYKFMVAEPIVVLLTTPIEVVVYKLLKYKVTCLPIINREKKILGIITIDDVSKIIRKKIL
jgi:CBS domain-containing protein/sporulation protein YlmC with PRC-barrel domain